MIYISRQYTATAVARRIHLHFCQKCGTEFGFEVLRFGTGTGTSPYMVNNEGAERRASESALRNAAEIAESNPEVVPCPKCDHIAGEMIDGWGRGAMRGFVVIASLLIITAIVGLVVVGWLAVSPPRRNPPEARTLLVLGGIFFAIAGLGALLIGYRRGRLRAMRPLPGPGAAQQLLDLGYLPALLVQPEADEKVLLTPVRPVARTVENNSLVISLLKSSPPAVCPDCLRSIENPKSAFGRCKRCRLARSFRQVLLAMPIAFVVWCVLVWAMADYFAREKDFWDYLASPIIALVVGGLIAFKKMPAEDAKCLDSLRQAWRVRSDNPEYLEILRMHCVDEVDYTVQLHPDDLQVLRAEAETRRNPPAVSGWARWWRMFKRAMTTDIGA